MLRQKRIMGLALSFFSTLSFAFSPILTIVPSTLSSTMRSDGATSIVYTVTNNTSDSLTQLTISPAYETTGQGNGYSLQNDACSNTTLSAGSSCEFGVSIDDQSRNFIMLPKICANENQACSTTTSSEIFNATVDSVSNPAYAYLVLKSGSSGAYQYALLPVNAETNAFGTPVTGLYLSNATGTVAASVAVSLDGSRVYAVEQPNSNNTGNVADVAVLSAGLNSQLLRRIPLTDITSTQFFSDAVSPDGETLYVTATDGSLNKVYAINLQTDAVNEISGTFSTPFSVALNPSGSRAFVANDGGGTVSVINTATNAVVQTISITDPLHIVVNPANTQLFVMTSTKIYIYTISANDTYNLDTVITSIFKPSAMTISSNGNTLYVTGSNDNKISEVNTQTDTVTSFTAGVSNNTGLQLTPDNTKLFVMPDLLGAPQVVSNLSTTPSVSSLSVSSVISGATGFNTQGAFVN